MTKTDRETEREKWERETDRQTDKDRERHRGRGEEREDYSWADLARRAYCTSWSAHELRATHILSATYKLSVHTECNTPTPAV